MARTFGAAQYLTKASALFTTYPFSFATWVNVTVLGGGNQMMIITTATGTDFFAVNVSGGHPVCAAAQTGVGTVSATSAATLATNTWTHIAGIFTSSTSRTIYVNGTGPVSNTTACAPASVTVTYVGGDPATFGDNLNGAIAFPAFWNVALSATDVAALAAGAHPRLVRPQSLTSCLNLTGGSSPEPDLISATAWTLNGASTESVNPRIYM